MPLAGFAREHAPNLRCPPATTHHSKAAKSDVAAQLVLRARSRRCARHALSDADVRDPVAGVDGGHPLESKVSWLTC